MKLLILLSVVSCGLAAKLDRTYLPPASAATAGGSGSDLAAPGHSAPGFGSENSPSFGHSGNHGASAFAQSAPKSPGFSQSAPSQGFGQQSYGNQIGSGFDQSGSQGSAQPQIPNFPGPRAQPERAQAAAEKAAEILKYENQNDGENFAYSFETSNGITAEESGVATNGVQAQGGFSYVGDDGQNYKVSYTADENGFAPQGDHLPTPHPIPEEIQKSIEKNAQAAAAGTQEGAYRPEEYESESSQGFNGAQSFNQAQGEQGYQYNAPNQGSAPIASGFQRSQGAQSGFQRPASSGPAPSGPQQAPSQYDSHSQGLSHSGSGFQQSHGSSQSAQSAFSRPQTGQSPSTGFQRSQAASGSGFQSQPSFQRPQTPVQSAPGFRQNSAQSGSQRPQGPVSSPSYQQPQGSFGAQQSRPQPSQSQFQGARAQAPSQQYGASAFGLKASASNQGSAGPRGQSAFPATQSFSEETGYEYNRPQTQFGARPSSPAQQFNKPSQGFSQPQPGQGSFGRAPNQGPASQPGQFNQGPQARPGQTFGGPRQPPSFSPEEGYKY